jgi:hypothetical protein
MVSANEYPAWSARYHVAHDFNRLRSRHNCVKFVIAAWSYAGQQAEGQHLIIESQDKKRIRARPSHAKGRFGTLTRLPTGHKTT